ncbi:MULTISPECIES: TIM barrel protein [unclassified Mesorhizobium]|uniref:hydroxypyruvate isomerase family protein n=1 Tax=unclassified Mesorhizobium TaxID=325217 RepID=UPI000FDACBB1|nr:MULTISPECIES: TIM barrel protein [unclassified Mesorhizobium]TGR22989.1 isomerase [Mesorhizobium sp. M8A.F.Ca.ET.197.01.1.1]TGR39073.1 isomerase [bacterium M00.F.Ca.ET.199.01.1.1]TGR46667.1 isomerase [Mesorhizobium sp. M8A.F.Ca.ET.198.01.1.1]TGV85259.1 isomerase [Mesorhizobium sp. M00.F.Ca.ET.149.01.1.1]
MKFSANLGFLWKDRPLPAAIREAKSTGFDAVECHWPYDASATSVKAALDESQLSMLGLNTRRGDTSVGENGLSALPGREVAARAAIDEALAYASEVSAGAVHVMAGNSSGPLARKTFCDNLAYACGKAGEGVTILIEPLNHYNAPGYFLSDTALAADIIREVGAPNLRMMFDFYHVQIMEGDVTRRFETMLPLVGHVQIAAVPDRGKPDHGELDYDYVLRRVADLGWDKPIGAEYIPEANVEPDMKWLAKYRQLNTRQI